MNRDIGNMYEKQRFTTLDIEQFLNTNEYQVIDDFSYAEIEGIAKICGYQIVFFIFQTISRYYRLMMLLGILF